MATSDHLREQAKYKIVHTVLSWFDRFSLDRMNKLNWYDSARGTGGGGGVTFTPEKEWPILDQKGNRGSRIISPFYNFTVLQAWRVCAILVFSKPRKVHLLRSPRITCHNYSRRKEEILWPYIKGFSEQRDVSWAEKTTLRPLRWSANLAPLKIMKLAWSWTQTRQ